MYKVQAPGNRGGFKLQATHKQSDSKHETNANLGIKITALKTTTFTNQVSSLRKACHMYVVNHSNCHSHNPNEIYER